MRTLHELHEKELKETEIEGGRATHRPETGSADLYPIHIGRAVDPSLCPVFVLPSSTILEEPVAAGERVAFGISKTVDKGKRPVRKRLA